MSLDKASLREALARLMGSRVSGVLARVSDFLSEQGIEAYLVGGLVRDALMGRETADIDLAVVGDALDIAAKVAAALGGRYVPLDEENRIARVVLIDEKAPSAQKQWELDFSTIEDSIEQDLARRDFTINAMAVDLNQIREGATDLQLIDPFKGRDDLRQSMIRVVTENAFVADAARLLRAGRLSAELGFGIEPLTEALIQGDAHLVATVAGERVREELLGLIAAPKAARSLSYFDRLGLLITLLPELAATKGAEQPKEHFWDVFQHSLETVAAVDFLLRQGSWEYAGEAVLAGVPWSKALEVHFAEEVSHGSTRRSLLKLAALFHDIAKPQTKTIEAGGRIRFLGHAQVGAETAANVLERLRFSGKEIKLVETEVRYHLRPTQMSQPASGEPTRRAIYRYFRDTGDVGIDILFLNLADHLATRGPHLDLAHWRQHAQMVEYVLSQHLEQERITSPAKLVNGHDLIHIYGLSPGPKIGQILEVVHEAQAAGEVTTREEALAYVGRLLTSKK